MAQSWHTLLEFEPPLVACVISSRNHSFAAIDATGECVINLPGAALADAIVGCGNTSGATLDKFAAFGLSPEPPASSPRR
jgi:flavin reductase (DIM6/NTAB) family NADH-FMN oxidoreductase RutF